jgi:hypothetical protein
MVVCQPFTFDVFFKIPLGLDLNDKSKVLSWNTTFEKELHVHFVDGTQAVIKSCDEPRFYFSPTEATIETAEDAEVDIDD